MRAACAVSIAIAACSVAACGAPRAEIVVPASRAAAFTTSGELHVAAEGPCARLSVAAIGAKRLLVYGDTGYDLAGWLPGDEVPAAQALAVLTPGGAGIEARLLAGLPRDDRGYVPGDLELGGSGEENAWLLRISTRYAPGGEGALFARESASFRLGPEGWRAAGDAVERPRATASLPELRTDACGEAATFVPLASATTDGGVLVAGRCDDARAPNPAALTLLVAHGRPAATSWDVRRVPGTENLDGIVNVAIAARADDDAVLVAWEPFVPVARRHAFAARFSGEAWAPLRLDLPGGYLDVAHDAAGDLLVANGRGAYRVDPRGAVTELPLPAPRFATGSPRDVHVHAIHTFGAEIWIEARYRTWAVRERPAVWASVLYTNASVPRTIHCDASEAADRAVAEVE